ncbi:hypothetical protein KCP78_10655 [Salmonella enterica subsp. enterica]|nr:hypothetical protein KCP78_10655 [Salmonella enterica subsp. enterica]
MKSVTTDDECWLVQARDASADGVAFAVRTTAFFCRPSCRSKGRYVKMFAFCQRAAGAGRRAAPASAAAG